jgi:hypothetical protein
VRKAHGKLAQDDRVVKASRIYRDPAGTLGCSNPVALGRPSTNRIVSRMVWITASFPTAVLSIM